MVEGLVRNVGLGHCAATGAAWTAHVLNACWLAAKEGDLARPEQWLSIIISVRRTGPVNASDCKLAVIE